MTRYRTEADEIAHLEPPEPRLKLFVGGYGTTRSGRGPAHRWGPIPNDPEGQRCSACDFRRWLRPELGTLYQHPRKNQLRMGTEPICRPRRKP